MDVPNVSPQFWGQQNKLKVNLADNQTLVFTLDDEMAATIAPPVNAAGEKVGSLDNDTLVFGTATIVDAIGNRVRQ